MQAVISHINTKNISLISGKMIMRLKTVLAYNIRTRRKEQGLTQEALAEKVKTVANYIAMIETEKRTPSFKMIERIAAVLNVEPTDLFATMNYPSEPAAKIRENLMEDFEKYLRATAKEIEDSKKI